MSRSVVGSPVAVTLKHARGAEDTYVNNCLRSWVISVPAGNVSPDLIPPMSMPDVSVSLKVGEVRPPRRVFGAQPASIVVRISSESGTSDSVTILYDSYSHDSPF